MKVSLFFVSLFFMANLAFPHFSDSTQATFPVKKSKKARTAEKTSDTNLLLHKFKPDTKGQDVDSLPKFKPTVERFVLPPYPPQPSFDDCMSNIIENKQREMWKEMINSGFSPDKIFCDGKYGTARGWYVWCRSHSRGADPNARELKTPNFPHPPECLAILSNSCRRYRELKPNRSGQR